MNESQAQQDRIENGRFPLSGAFTSRPQAQHEPSSKCCKAPFIQRSADVFECIGCRRLYTSVMLESAGIDTRLIG